MFSTSTIFSLVSLSLLSTAAMASPLQARATACDGRKPGELCKLNGQDYNSDTTLTNSFGIDVAGHVGSNSAMRFLSLDFQEANQPNSAGEITASSNFHVIDYDITKKTSEPFGAFHYDDIKVPCGLSGKSFLNIVGHSSAGVNNTVTVEEQRFGPFNVNGPAC